MAKTNKVTPDAYVAPTPKNNQKPAVEEESAEEHSETKFDLNDHSWCCNACPKPIKPKTGWTPLDPKYNCPTNECGIMCSVGVHEGSRAYFEDRHRVVFNEDGFRGYFGVYDGHGGSKAAHFTAEHMYDFIMDSVYKIQCPKPSKTKTSSSPAADDESKDAKNGAGTPSSTTEVINGFDFFDLTTKITDYRSSLVAATENCELNLLEDSRRQNYTSGSTCSAILVRGNSIACINTGDSRAVLGKKDGTAVDLSVDHKPSIETARILAAGGDVGCLLKDVNRCMCFGTKETRNGPDRLWPGGFAVSRTLGDIKYKDKRYGKTKSDRVLIWDAEVTVSPITSDDEFVIVATDGFWDVYSSEDAVTAVNKWCSGKKFDPMSVAQKLCDKAYSFGGSDNITVLVVYLTHYQSTWPPEGIASIDPDSDAKPIPIEELESYKEALRQQEEDAAPQKKS